ncbi:nucleoside triphosphate pyrophosphohydrolase [Streptomyces albidoflavus]|uniref:Nucleoside triphosphate pyrophosphohydrolase n=3 Tax=Streptomyces TaxID=1883 RepID=D6B2U8_9ACTN|nr:MULTISPECIES: nucleoside triphosphate pyrophosphohydrolase [Streptomyces]MYX49294.1 nucleoside triphosphate pyrophosphohydrolase [Streptomyces sp. SID8385]QLA56995.1 nucleoside triphosphate pyrophosphohydrolase [Streptomyces violascens]SCD79512.1 XTP/dITP diphosphohydrolase [Streptomyces sp. IgraMP-1]BDH51041.1 nucleoside triphosphate pyrophosphohydrolase [Streptomyces albus]AGI88386.1 Nucleoside triphosphate pyrophosphohydrolase MazG [Streptomyces albidoflavus]
MNAPSPGRLVLLTTSHRVAPGQLSWPAWQALHQADRVLCADPAHPQLPYLREAGVEVEVAATPDAADLVDFLAGGRTAVLVQSGEGDRRLTDALSRLAGSGRVAMPDLELLPGAYDLPGARLIDLVQVMDRIREECPWSARQTHEGLAKYAMEEAFELIEAIEEGDRDALREELGDVLLQVVFHARIAEDGAPATGDDEEDGGPFSVDDVAATLIDKLVRRHPHVFGDAVAETPEEVRAQWLRVKGEEKERTSVTDGVPVAQPALALAAKLASRARGAELRVPLPEGPGPGPALLALAVEAERQGTDPEAALRESARRYREAIRAAEGH